jgi:5'-nucleotidase (lipoprotein e(P4) family)
MNARNQYTIIPTVILLMAVPLAGCAVHKTVAVIDQPLPEAHEQLNSVLWVQTSPEYEAVCRGIYNLATLRLDEALADMRWTALSGQTQAYEDLPPAVIVDIDETVLDNSAFEARLILEVKEYNKPMWDAWIAEEAAPAVPGAQGFIEHALDRGVDVFFVTNRDHDTEEHTVRNLRSNFGARITGEQVLTRGERADWTLDKTSRRDYLAATHRILLLIGDDLGDFIHPEKVTPGTRRDDAGKYAGLWGTKWIMLPNPMYGAWEQALYGYDRRLERAEKLKEKQKSLEPSE